MPELLTIGETMAAFAPRENGPLCYIHDFTLRAAGSESNVAAGVCKLGHTAGWISRLGGDGLGRFILNAVRADGVDASHVPVVEGERTGAMVKEMSAGGETSVYYYRDGSAFSHYTPEMLDEGYLADCRVLYLTGITPLLGEGCLQAVQRALQAARAAGAMIAFDPNIRLKLWAGRDCAPLIRGLMLQSDIALLGVDEAQRLLGTGSPKEICEILFREGRVRMVAIKNGDQGAWAAVPGELYPIKPHPCRCIDPVGAGDSFNAGFLCGVLEEAPVLRCGEMGAVCGALATQTVGDTEGQPTRRQLDSILQNSDAVYR